MLLKRNSYSAWVGVSLSSIRSTLLILSVVAGVTGCDSKPQSSGYVTVAIAQVVDHLALNEERAGVLEVLREGGYIEGQNLKVIYQNAQGNLALASQIARNLVAAQPQVLVGISTPSAQSLLAARGTHPIPLVFTAVSDPVGARLVQTLKGGDQVTGVSDHLAAETQVDLVLRFHPQLKTLGVIYNLGETNSVSSVRELENVALARGIVLIASPVSGTPDVAQAAQKLVGKVEAVYVPNDNTAISAIEAIVQVGIKNQLPIYTGDQGSVEKGAVATVGYSRRKLGREAGQQVLRLLKGEKAQNIPVAMQHPLELVLNLEGAKKMGVLIPKVLPSGTVYISPTGAHPSTSVAVQRGAR